MYARRLGLDDFTARRQACLDSLEIMVHSFSLGYTKSMIIVLKLYGTTVSHVSAMPHRHGMAVASKYFTSYNNSYPTRSDSVFI